MPADPTVVEIELDQTRVLKFDHNALADLDIQFIKQIGMPFFEAFSKETEVVGPDGEVGMVSMYVISPGPLRLMLWAGLKWNFKNLSIEKVGKFMQIAAQENGVDLKYIAQQCMLGLQGSGIFGKPDDLGKALEELETESKKAKTGNPAKPVPVPSQST